MSDPWDAHKDIYYENMIANERPVLKPSWTFPSPFFPYAVATYMVRDPIAWGPQPRTVRVQKSSLQLDSNFAVPLAAS
jgi:hypothetical protein